MNRLAAVGVGIVALFAASPVPAMSNYDDPRVVLSYMDRSLSGARDILRVTTSVSGDTHLVFEVKTRAADSDPEAHDYVLLQISQGRSYQLMVPIDPDSGDVVLDYERELAPGGGARTLAGSELTAGSGDPGFTARRVPRGVEFWIPLAWVDYSEKIAFDAFTVRGQPSDRTFWIDEVYDQADKARKEERRVSPVTLLNNLCATRK